MNRRDNRPKLQADALLSQIQHCIRCLQTGYIPVYAKPVGTPSEQTGLPTAVDWRLMDTDEHARYKTLLATQLKLLDKCMPNLKLVGVQDERAQSRLSVQELAQRLRGILAITGTAGKTH